MAERKTDVFRDPATPNLLPSVQVGASGVDPRLNMAADALRSVSKTAETIRRTEESEQLARTKAAMKSISDMTNLQVTGTLSQIVRETPNNPGAIQNSGNSVIENAAEFLPELSRQTFIAKHRIDLANKVAVANSMAIKAQQVIATETSNILESEQNAELSRVSKNRFSSEPQLKMSADAQVSVLFNEINGRMEEMGVDFKGDPFPLFTREQRADTFIHTRNLSIEEGLVGRFDESADKAGTLLGYMNGEFRIFVPKSVNESGEVTESTEINALDLLPDKGRALISRLNTKLRAINSIEGEQDRLDEESRERDQALNLFDAYETIQNPDSEKSRITVQEVEEQVLAGALDPGKAIRLLDAVTTPAAETDDPLLLRMLIRMSSENQDISDFLDEAGDRLKVSTLWRLRKENKATQSRLSGIVESDRDRFVRQEGKSLEKTLTFTSPFSNVVDPNEEVRKAEAMTEFNRRAEEGEDPVELRRELSRRGRMDALNGDEFTSSLLKPRFIPVKRQNINHEELENGAKILFDSVNSGKISREEYELQKDLYIEWDEQLIKKEESKEKSKEEEARKKSDGR